MAVNYTTLFTKAGKLIKYVMASGNNSYQYMHKTQIPADLQAIAAAFGTAATTFGQAGNPIQGLDATMEAMQGNATAWRQSLASYVTRALLDKDNVLSQLSGLRSTDINTVLDELIADMIVNSQTVKMCGVTVGTVTAGSGNVGNGTAVIDTVLDGYNQPLRDRGFASICYDGKNSELAVPSETMELTCVSDAGNGATEGNEGWQWAGGIQYPSFDFHPEGSGLGPSLNTANGNSTVPNMDWETFTSNAPGSWTIDGGTAGVNIFQETSTSHIYRGSSALKIVGDGVTNPIQLSYSISTLVNSRRRYLAGMMLKRGGTAPSSTSEKVTLKITGTNYAPIPVGAEYAVGDLTTSYALGKLFANIPSKIPSDLKLVISIGGSVPLTSGAILYLDSGFFKPVVYHGGINATVLAGSTPWAKGDKLSWTVANNEAGIIQNFFRRHYGVQLPSSIAGDIGTALTLPFLLITKTVNPSISDSLAA